MDGGLHMAGLFSQDVQGVGEGHRVFVDDGAVGVGLATRKGSFVLVGNIYRAHKVPCIRKNA